MGTGVRQRRAGGPSAPTFITLTAGSASSERIPTTLMALLCSSTLPPGSSCVLSTKDMMVT